MDIHPEVSAPTGRDQPRYRSHEPFHQEQSPVTGCPIGVASSKPPPRAPPLMHSRFSTALLASTLLAFPEPGLKPTAAPLLARVDSVLASKERELIDVRHDLHRNPETSGNEVRTASIVATRLRTIGLEVRSGVGGHGVVGVLGGGRPGPVVAYRADMDAVPSNDPDPLLPPGRPGPGDQFSSSAHPPAIGSTRLWPTTWPLIAFTSQSPIQKSSRR